MPDDTYIMEIKILGAMPLWLTHLLSENRLFSHGFSKYGVKYKQEAQAHQLEYLLLDDNGNPVDFEYFKEKTGVHTK